MVTILIPSGDDSEKIAITLYSLIRRRYATMFIGDSVYRFDSGNPRFCIAVCPPNKKIDIDAGPACIVLITDNVHPHFSIPAGAVVLSFSEACPDLSLDGTQQLISCGLRQRDTLTLSSLESQKPVFSVQRTINTLQGELLEIGEYPLVLNEVYSHRDIIAAAAVLLISHGTLEPDTFAPPV